MLVRKPGLGTRSIAVGIWWAWMAAAAPPLTTIQDVLYKADGTRFNGVAAISWKSFESTDTSNITMQSLTVRVVDGNLRVQLVPNADSQSTYTVRYNSDGKIQFDETWVVPASGRPLRVRDVRVRTAPAALDAGGLPIQESDVVGLVADLGARPAKGPGYATGRAAVVTANGTLETVSGDPSDCVRVDGSSGPCGAPSVVNLRFADGETPAGTVDGSNTAFTLGTAPNPPASLLLYRNGMLQKPGQDFNLTANTVQFVAAAAPQPGDTLLASYRLPLSQAVGLPQVLCSGTGTRTTGTAPALLGGCSIGPGALLAGDRVEILFDYAHEGAAAGFAFSVGWGGTTVLDRSAGASETLVTGRGEATLTASGAQIGVQSWGSTLPLEVGLAAASDAYSAGLAIGFSGKLAGAGGDALSLQHFSVVRYPGTPQP